MAAVLARSLGSVALHLVLARSVGPRPLPLTRTNPGRWPGQIFMLMRESRLGEELNCVRSDKFAWKVAAAVIKACSESLISA
jgi:hypothetical protein